MGKTQLKFLSIPEALQELKNTLAVQSELTKQEEIEPVLARMEDFEIRKDTIKVHPSDFVDRPGLWIKSYVSKQFYSDIDLEEFLIDRLNSKPPETVAQVYSMVEWVNASVAKHNVPILSRAHPQHAHAGCATHCSHSCKTPDFDCR
jgi:hypothetical protein